MVGLCRVGIGLLYCLDGRFAIEVYGDLSLFDVVNLAYCADDVEASGYSCELAAVGALDFCGARYYVDGNDSRLLIGPT